MSDPEVQKTLNEIRERVRVQIRSQAPAVIKEGSDPRRVNSAAIESLRANLSVVERSWNRLPPIISYRSSWISKVELWLKRCLKKLTFWYTWEQVNFNSATANSLKEIMAVLSSHEDTLNEVREQLEKLSDANRSIQIDLQSMPANGRFNLEAPGENIENTNQTQSVDDVDATRLSKIDSEISNLAARIESLRKMKARLHGSDDPSLER